MENTDAEWEKWGKLDPYFGVVSLEKFNRANISDNREEFFSGGEHKIEYFIERLENAFGPIKKSRALDFGCGVGRLSIPLSRRFGRVLGLDISTSMLTEAKRNAASMGVDNVEFREATDSLDAAVGGFDLVVTYIVLQHIPVARGLQIIDKLLSKVDDGGGCVIHFSVRDGGLYRAMKQFIRRNIPFSTNVWNLVNGQPAGTPLMQMNDYPLVEIVKSFERYGIVNLLMLNERHDGVLTISLLGRRL